MKKTKIVKLFIITFLLITVILPSFNFDVLPRLVFANPRPNELKFAVTSDIHFGQTPPSPYTEEQQMLETMYNLHPDFIVDCGDWIGNNAHANWNDAQDAYQTRANFTIFHVLGNHDDQAYYSGDRDDIYPLYSVPQWIDEASGDPDVYAYLKDNVLFIFLSLGVWSNNFLRFRYRQFVEYLVGEKFTTQTWMMFVHDGMNATVGHAQTIEAPLYQYKTGWQGSTEVWAENLLSDYGSRCLGVFMGHIHYEPEDRNATWQYGTYHFPVGMKAEQYFWFVNLTASGYTARSFMYDGTEQTLTRMDNATFTPSYDTSKDDELLIPMWVQNGSPLGQLRIFCLSESRKLDLVGVRGNETYVNPDMWLENIEGLYNGTNPTLRTWQGRTDYGSYWKSKEDMTGDDWIHVVHVINVTSVPSSGWSALRSWTLRYQSTNYYNVSLRAKASVNGVSCGVREGATSGAFIVNWTLTTDYEWYYSSSSAECINGVGQTQISLMLWDNTTYYIDFFGWRLNGVTDSMNTTDPSITINGNIYDYDGTLNPKQNYTYSDFPFPSTNYDGVTASSVSGNKEVMVVVRYINPTWRITNSAVSKSGNDVDTNTATSDYNNTRIITYMNPSPANPQVMIMRGIITGFVEPSWASSTLTFNVTGTGNALFIVDCADQGNATSVTDNGSPISFVYDSSAELISFSITLESEHEIVVAFGGETPTLTIHKPENTTYSSGSIPVNMSATGGTIDTYLYNCWNISASAWIYSPNQTYTTPTTMTNFVNGTYRFHGWVNNTDGNWDTKNVTFTVAIPSDDTLYEYYNTGFDSEDSVYSIWGVGQTFTPSVTHNVTYVKLLMRRVGIPYNLTVGIRATSGGVPTGPDLTNGTVDANDFTTDSSGYWYRINFDSSIQLNAGTQYAIVALAPDGDRVMWKRDNTSPTYGGGTRIYSSDTGSTWNASASADMMFEEWGIPLATPTLTIHNPQNTTYSTGTIPVNMSASGGTIDTYLYNCWNISASAWIYPSNLTYTTPTSMTGYVNGTYRFHGWVNNTLGNWDTANVTFTVAIPAEENVIIEIYGSSIDDSRINVGATAYVRMRCRFNTNGSYCTTGTLYINATACSINGTGWATRTYSTSSVIILNFTVTGVNVNGETDFDQQISDPQVIWDRLQVQSYTVSDTRTSINVNVNIDTLIWFDYDNTPCTTATITINGYSATHQGSGVYRITRTSTTVTSVTYNTVVCSAESTYGITSVDQNSQSGTVIWDKARIYYQALDDARVDISTNIEFRVKCLLLYDNHPLGSGDTVTANFGSLTWDAGNSWFDGTRSQATVGSYVFQISSLSEATYGITTFEVNVTNPTGIWDKQTVTLSASDTTPENNTDVTVSWTIIRQYDSSSVSSFTIDIDRNASLYGDDLTNSSIIQNYADLTYNYTSSAVTDNTYGLTAFQSNTVTVTWSASPPEEEGIDIPEFSPPSILQFWYEGDLFGFFQALFGEAFTSVDVFYAFFAFLVSMAIYIRTKSLILLTILAFLVLGSGLMLAMPLVSGLGILLMIFGVAGLFYKLYTSRYS